MEFQKLTVYHYAEDSKEDRRITLLPMNINAVAAEIDDVQINGISRRNVTILFSDGGAIDMCVNHQDLELIETAVGSFCLG